jgi:hypothetical protein
MNGSVYKDLTQRFQDGHILVVGRLLTGNSDVLRATDLGMGQIKALMLQGAGRTPVGSISDARFVHVEGSLGSVTAKGSSNYARIRAWGMDSYTGVGTLTIGTLHGSARVQFVAHGL